MKTYLPIVLFSVFFFAGCRKTGSEINMLGKITEDSSQPIFIRDSAQVFKEVLEGKKVSSSRYEKAIKETSATRNETTCKALVAMLHGLEKRFPDKMPTIDKVMKLEKSFRGSGDVEATAYRSVLLAEKLLYTLTYFDTKYADSIVDKFRQRFKKKHNDSEVGKHFIRGFEIVVELAKDQRRGYKGQYEAGRKRMGLE
ncbi:MAG: hypothetical protein V4733_12720 [Verrucomicrobiota bacterium]